MNAFALKELRQFVRNRFIYITINVYMIAQLIAIYLVLSKKTLFIQTSHTPATGENIMWAVIGTAGVFTVGVLPVFSYVRNWNDRNSDSYDMYFLTRLYFLKIVIGKMWAHMLSVLLFLAISAATLALAYVVRGIDLFSVLKAFIVIFIMSCGVHVIALIGSFFCKNVYGRVLITAALLLSLLFLSPFYFVILMLIFTALF